MEHTLHEKIPDKLVVLTFDDGCKSQATFVGPLLKRYGFGATFYITEGLNFLTNKDAYMTWEEVRGLHDAGFEIGNHTRHHRNVTQQSAAELHADLEHIDAQCAAYGISQSTTFCYPGYSHGAAAVAVLAEYGFAFARRGVAPEFPYDGEGGRGPAYDPTQHHPLLIPTTGAAGPHWDFDDFTWALAQARDGNIAILTFHGVPDIEHPWVHTEPEQFEAYMAYLAENDYKVIALRDLVDYVPLARFPNLASDGGLRKS